LTVYPTTGIIHEPSKKGFWRKALFWVGSSLGDLLTFPEAVKDEMRTALSVARFGGKHPSAKPWKGVGSGVFEIVEDHRGNTYRVIYTVRFEDAVYTLHVFQKKITERNQDAQERCGVDSPAADTSPTRLRGAAW
jgi:phage-related protein